MTVGIVIGIVASTIRLWPIIIEEAGTDYEFFMWSVRHWRITGDFYLLEQLEGPYIATSGIHVLYPPVALWLFVPFLYLPAALWWAIPLGIVGWHVVTSRPAWWAWPVLAILCWLPRDQSIVIWGNTTMWITAFVALAIRTGYVAPFVLLKPTFAPFALLGAPRRAWVISVAVLAALALPMPPLWFDYLTAMRNNVGDWPGLLYSVPDYLFAAIPLVAWAARTSAAPGTGSRSGR